VDGISYFVYADVWYRPYYSGSDVIYTVVEKPEATKSEETKAEAS
jgi:hypothetical protein